MTGEGSAPGAPAAGTPEAGGFAVDARDGRVGRVVGRSGPNVRLRPPGGGPEWECPSEAVRGFVAGGGPPGPGGGGQQGEPATALRRRGVFVGPPARGAVTRAYEPGGPDARDGGKPLLGVGPAAVRGRAPDQMMRNAM